MKKEFIFSSLLLPALLLLLSTSCTKDTTKETSGEASLMIVDNASTQANKSLQTELLKSLRSATSKFYSTTQAIKAGYVRDNHCVSVPNLGGMGYHWVNGSLVDPVFDPLKPEALLYATGPGGNLRLVGVEYIVINSGQPIPSFGNQLFSVGGAPIPVDHWTLHVWVHESNPSGMFAPFNPNITCP